MSAAELFNCHICKEDRNQEEASFDVQFAAPICEECRRNSLWAIAWMKKEGITRPLSRDDITQENHKRFML